MQNNQDQIDLWNGEVGEKWVRYATILDQMLAPFSEELCNKCDFSVAQNFLDIGCGAGALTISIAQQMHKAGTVSGVDISLPLIALAEQRAQQAEQHIQFKKADAATLQSKIRYDTLLSRFGIMFFSDPAEAFANIKNNASESGKLLFFCWQSLADNEWALAPLSAARPFLREPPTPPAPGTPGPFAFADKNAVYRHLNQAGWKSIQLTEFTTEMILPGTHDLETAEHMLNLGPVSGLIREQEIDLRPVADQLAQQIADRRHSDGKARYGAAAWMVYASV
ncbi:MAG: class I SAM-dependent methyltransferase [bacterium]